MQKYQPQQWWIKQTFGSRHLVLFISIGVCIIDTSTDPHGNEVLLQSFLFYALLYIFCFSSISVDIANFSRFAGV